MKDHRAKVLVTLVVLGLIAAGCTGTGNESSASPGGVELVRPVIPDPGASLIAIDGVSADDIWAVGESHRISEVNDLSSLTMHWDGSRWSVVAAPDVGRLGAMAAITADDAWALGSGLLHWDGTSWHEVRPPRGMGAEYDAISASGPNDVWLAGVRDGPFIGASTGGLSTVIAHFDGRRWTQMVPPNPGTRDNYLNGIVALAPDDVWAAGYSTDVGKSEPEDSTLTMHWDGSSWSVIPSPDPSRSLNVIWGLGSDGGSGIWALGHFRAADHNLHALVLRWDGSAWTQIGMPRSAEWSATVASATSTHDVWVLGTQPTWTLVHCEEKSCRTVIAPAPRSSAIGESVVAFTPDDAWLVGGAFGAHGQVTPFVEHWDGTTWTQVAAPTGIPAS